MPSSAYVILCLCARCAEACHGMWWHVCIHIAFEQFWCQDALEPSSENTVFPTPQPSSWTNKGSKKASACCMQTSKRRLKHSFEPAMLRRQHQFFVIRAFGQIRWSDTWGCVPVQREPRQTHRDLHLIHEQMVITNFRVLIIAEIGLEPSMCYKIDVLPSRRSLADLAMMCERKSCAYDFPSCWVQPTMSPLRPECHTRRTWFQLRETLAPLFDNQKVNRKSELLENLFAFIIGLPDFLLGSAHNFATQTSPSKPKTSTGQPFQTPCRMILTKPLTPKIDTQKLFTDCRMLRY